MKKFLFISLAIVLALSMGLIGCGDGGGGEYDLTIASGGGGSVTTPAEGTHTYDAGEVVNLVATPDTGCSFNKWTGDVAAIADVNDASTTITMNADYSITANFIWDGAIELSFHCTANPTASVWEYVYQPWIWAVQNATGPDGGTFEFTVTFGETPYSAEDSLTALSDGVVDVGQLSTDTFHLGAIGYLPFLFSMESAAYATHYIYEEDWDALGELDDVKMLIASPLQPAQWWGNVEVTELADLYGVDVRAEGDEVPIIDALGANAVEVGTMQLYSALDTGMVEGCFFTYSGGRFWLSLHEVTTYTAEVNMVLPRYMLAMHRATYDGLQPDAKALLDTFCTADYSVQYAKDHEAAQGAAKGALSGYRASQGQSPIYVIPPAELANWKAACDSVFDDFVSDLDDLNFDGQGILNRVEELIAEYEAS